MTDSDKKDRSVLRTIKLDNGLTLEFFDQSNRYFGDYHRIKILLIGRIPVAQHLPSDLAGLSQEEAINILGTEVCYEKTLQRMGVATAEADAVKQQLIDDFLTTGGRYLSQSNFPGRYVVKQLEERRKKIRPFQVPNAFKSDN